ncbi:Uncharacterised protein [Mycobacteroides abscessus subsp. abscessus]|nr:Uncharacterised protein [Mycobacteroides abscessus subsp. abscessus]
MSSSSGLFSATMATGTSPHLSCERPMTAASRIFGWLKSTFSTSAQ